jgi:tannase
LTIYSIHYIFRSFGEESLSNLQDWYQFYLVPGAAHFATNSLQPGHFSENNMDIMIDSVENGAKPTRLNATVLSGKYAGENQQLCQWPTRPLWCSNTTFDCVTDKNSCGSWTYDFPAFKVPVY